LRPLTLLLYDDLIVQTIYMLYMKPTMKDNTPCIITFALLLFSPQGEYMVIIYNPKIALFYTDIYIWITDSFVLWTFTT